MFDGMSKPTFLVATLIGGLALFVAGFIIAAEMRSVAASPTAATTGGGANAAGVLKITADGTYHVPLSFNPSLILVDAADYAVHGWPTACMYQMISFGAWTASGGNSTAYETSPERTDVCTHLSGTNADYAIYLQSWDVHGYYTSTGYITNVTAAGFDIVFTLGQYHQGAVFRWAAFEPGAGPTVGGIGQLPNVAGTGDSLPRSQIIIAAVTAMIAFGAGGWYAKRRWMR